MLSLDEAVKRTAKERLRRLEAHLQGDVAFFYGSIEAGLLRSFRDFIEKTAAARPGPRSADLLSKHSRR